MKIKLSKKQWEHIGKEHGWIEKKAQGRLGEADWDDIDWLTNQLRFFIGNPTDFWDTMTYILGTNFTKAKNRDQLLKKILGKLKNEDQNLAMLSKEEQKIIAKELIKIREKIKEEENREKFIENLKENRSQSVGDSEKKIEFLDIREMAPVAVQEIEDLGKKEQPSNPSAEIDEENMFANRKEIEDIKNSLLDRYNKGEITKDQLANMLKEFAKKYNKKVILSISGKAKIIH